MPDKGITSIKLHRYGRQLKSSFLIYADFERILTKAESKEHKIGKPYSSKYKIILLEVVNQNYFALMITLVSLQKITWTKAQFMISLVLCL